MRQRRTLHLPRLADLAAEWRRLRASHPGRRFHERFERKHSEGRDRRWHRIVYIAGGSVIFAVGAALKAIPLLPGGTAVMAAGAAMVSRESHTAAAWLDKTEVRVRNTVKAALRVFRWRKRT